MSDDTATWTNYDYALMKHLELAQTPKEALNKWIKAARYTEPPAQAREFGYKVTDSGAKE